MNIILNIDGYNKIWYYYTIHNGGYDKMSRLLTIFSTCFILLSGCSDVPQPVIQQNIVEKSPEEKIQEIIGTDEAESKAIYDIIVNSGIIMESIKSDQRLDNYQDSNGTGYWITTPNVNEVIVYLNPDKTVLAIRYRKEYVYKDGQIVKLLYDAASEGSITLAEFEKIKTSMTYGQVVNIIGGEGQTVSEVDLGIGKEYATKICQWDGWGSIGANANVTFQGGKVAAKAQSGLD